MPAFKIYRKTSKSNVDNVNTLTEMLRTEVLIMSSIAAVIIRIFNEVNFFPYSL